MAKQVLANLETWGTSRGKLNANFTELYTVTDALQANAGIPFRKTTNITSAAAATPIHVLPAATVGAGKKAYITGIILNVSGATAWTDLVGTVVNIQDTANSPIVGAIFDKTALLGNVTLGIFSAGCALSAPISQGLGFTTAKGIDIAADANFAAGSDIIITIFGYIA